MDCQNSGSVLAMDCHDYDRELYRKASNYLFRRTYEWIIFRLSICIALLYPVIVIRYIGPYLIRLDLLISGITIFFIVVLYISSLIIFVSWFFDCIPGYPNMNGAGRFAITKLCPKTLQLVLDNPRIFDRIFINLGTYQSFKLDQDSRSYHSTATGPNISTRMDQVVKILKKENILYDG